MSTDSLWSGIKGIVLDAVGTLIEPVPSVARVYASVAERRGILLSLEEVQSRFRRHFRNDEADETRGPMVTDEVIEWARWRRIVANVLPEVPDGNRAFEELWEHFGRPEAWKCFPDVAPAVGLMIETGLEVRIASNFDGRLRTVVAGLPELSPVAKDLVISSEIGFRKPHPHFYEAACRSMNLPPERVLCLGDDLENDVRGPARAGLRSVLIDRKEIPSDLQGIFRDLLELLQTRRQTIA